MADLETTQSKLRSTPTAGVAGEHSAYYRRLLSAGYKGYIQGSIGGGTLYGALGAAIGGVVSVGFIAATAATGGAAALPLLLIPGLGTAFGLYGSHTFGEIGKTAAMLADSAENNEKRRYLLDRYYETPSDEEAKEIKRQLEEDNAPKEPTQFFHWRPALVGAAIGIALFIAIPLMAGAFPALSAHFVAIEMLHGIGIAGTTALAATGAAIGALSGAIIGIDREHIRRWLDKAEFTVHETGNAEREIAEREQNIQRIAEAAKRDTPATETTAGMPQKKDSPDMPAKMTSVSTPQLDRDARPDPISPHSIAGLNEPKSQVSAVQHDNTITQGKVLAQAL